MAKKYRIQKIRDARKVETPFGVAHEFFRESGDMKFDVAKVSMTSDSKHYHKKTKEVYYVISGRGEIELNGRGHEIGPDTAIIIEPGTRHRTRAYEGRIVLLVFSMPAYDPDDVVFEEEK